MAANQDPFSHLKALGSVSRLRGSAASDRLRANAHIHLPPNFSAFVSISEAVDRAAAEDVRVLGASNYYDYGAYGDFGRIAWEKGVFPLFGLEVICLIEDLVRSGVKINDPGNPGKMYLCGKGITRFSPMNATATRLVGTIRDDDGRRMALMIDRVGRCFRSAGLEMDLTSESVKALVAARHGVATASVYLQERHVAQAFQEALFRLVPPAARLAALSTTFGTPATPAPDDAVAVQNEIRSRLMKAGKPGFVEEAFVDFGQAYTLILALGGIPCYPVLADGATPICAFEAPVEQLIASLQERRIYCAELIPNRNKPEVLEHYVRALRSAGIVVLGGTEHNTLDLAPLTPQCAGGLPVPEWVDETFWEGVCVVAAHQFLTAQGEPGFVTESGTANEEYASGEERIASFARLGSAVIGAFLHAAERD